MLISGYAGTGKSTLVKRIVDDLPKIIRMNKLLVPDVNISSDLILTATTNKAAEALSAITKHNVVTIHSLLGLIVRTDYKTGNSEISIRQGAPVIENSIIIVDEASYIDHKLLKYIIELTRNCKIILIGDPAQLLSRGTTKPPAFSAGFPEAKLTNVLRQAKGNPIIELATRFRNTVNDGKFFSFKPDNVHIKYLPFDQFSDEIIKEFNRPDWKDTDSKVLAWRNRCVIEYNNTIRDKVLGEPQLQPGDYAVCNSYISTSNCRVKTDETVLITSISRAIAYGVMGAYVTMDRCGVAFMPDSLEDKKARLKKAIKEDDMDAARAIRTQWIDLRAAYACTINKSQGSTYKRVFIDLNDIKACNVGNTIARMLYVGVSRAQQQVILTGDLV